MKSSFLGLSLCLFDPSLSPPILPTLTFSLFILRQLLRVKFCFRWIYIGINSKPGAPHIDAKGCLRRRCHMQKQSVFEDLGMTMGQYHFIFQQGFKVKQ